ncbi:MAG: hypothetical protein JO186_06350 [Actinobacteria bacterium]|nr:hypothetical protein [Actinomycetota bacterium]MBV8480267.1 hypothetical protein [Actinomycetota bacterium]
MWRRASFGAALLAAFAVAFGLGGAGSGADGPWPDAQVAAQWPTFASVPAAESGGGVSGWNGVFWGCVPSSRVSADFACEYRDAQARTGYVCVAPEAVDAPITPIAIDARVAPDDPTYAGEPPTSVCYSALAYRLSIG